MTMTVSLFDPLADTRWEDLLERHPCASVFHSRGWLEALRRTYGYEPVVLTATSRGRLKSGLVLCRIRTLMSRRLVSLPFSDHCEPLVDSPHDLAALLQFLEAGIRDRRWSSFELRPRSLPLDGPQSAASYCLHTLDISRSPEQIFDAFHHSSTKRAIHRAERERLGYESGTSPRLLSSFYDLLRMTRRRHGLPPQPLAWFRNLVACLREKVTIHVADQDGAPIAGMLTLSFKKTMVYKYGGSDARQHRLGGMPYLFWRAIQDAKVHGIEELDLGRSDLDQAGLVRFKDHLGAARSMMTYYTSPHRPAVHARPISRAVRRLVVDHLPDAALDLTSRLLYKHLG
jgi:CelD/BcsL family acetyltransferase involved in cellulose biosynthesis